MDSDILPTLVLHVSDNVAADSVLRHRAEVALLGLDLLGPLEHPPERGGDVAPRLVPPGWPGPPGEPEGTEEQPLPAPQLLHV